MVDTVDRNDPLASGNVVQLWTNVSQHERL